MNLRLASKVVVSGVAAFGASTVVAQAAFSSDSDNREVTADRAGGIRSNVEVLQTARAGDVTVQLTLSTDPSGAQCLSAEVRDSRGPIGMLGGCDDRAHYDDVIRGTALEPIAFDGLVRLRNGGVAQVIGGLASCTSCSVTAVLSDGGQRVMEAAGHGFVSIQSLEGVATSFDVRDIERHGAVDQAILPTVTRVIVG